MKNPYKYFTSGLVLCLVSASLFAQDMLNMNDFNFKEENFNTAYLAQDSTNLNLSTIVSINDAVSNSTRFHFLMYGNLGKSGLAIGAKVNSSFRNIFQTTSAEMLLSKKVNLGKEHSIRLGINSGIIANQLNTSMLNGNVNFEDPLLLNQALQKFGYTIGAGFNYNWADKLDVGISSPFMVQSINGFEPVYFTNVSYKQKFNDFSLRPQLLLYGPNYIQPSIEGSVMFEYKNLLWTRIGGRSTKQLVLGAGVNLDLISVGYYYNMAVGNDFDNLLVGKHSINVGFNFLAKKRKKQTQEAAYYENNEYSTQEVENIDPFEATITKNGILDVFFFEKESTSTQEDYEKSYENIKAALDKNWDKKLIIKTFHSSEAGKNKVPPVLAHQRANKVFSTLTEKYEINPNRIEIQILENQELDERLTGVVIFTLE